MTNNLAPTPSPYVKRGMTRKKRRIIMIVTCLLVIGTATGLILYALRDGIVFFHSPTDVIEKNIQQGARFRLGGLVINGSIIKGNDQNVSFKITDTKTEILVNYRGILPDLFREGQGVVVEGNLTAKGIFQANTVLAKHDETYMPREVSDALKKQGHWQGENKGDKGTKSQPNQ